MLDVSDRANVASFMHFFFNQFAPTSVGTSIPALQIKPFHKSDYYSPLP